jgi:sensor histidine kinase regulating citrate/malate metabolism
MYLMHQIFQISSLYVEYSSFAIITGLLLFLINYVIFEIYDWMSKDIEIQAQNRLYKQQLELCSKQLEEQEAFFFEIRRMKHDMKNHLSSLQGMLHAKDLENADIYIQNLLNDGIDSQIEFISHSGNIVIDSLINHKYTLAKKENIVFKADILIPSTLSFQSEHLVIILGNLLENAIEACLEVNSNERYIHLAISYEKNMLYICINNSCLPKSRKKDAGKYITTKKDRFRHGIGLSSVEQAINQYHGELITEDSGNNFQAIVVLVENPDI